MSEFKSYQFKAFINETLKSINFTKPTLIQQKVIPLLLKNQNLVVRSHTGTGKTHAFLLPIFQNLTSNPCVQVIIITPTRELASQIYMMANKFKDHNSFLTIAKFIGGEDNEKIKEKLSKVQPQIVIATPGKLKQLYDHHDLKLTTATRVIIDECDMIFDLDFINEVDYLLSKLRKDINLAVFSATIAEKLKPFLSKYLNNSILIDIVNKNISKVNINHILIPTKHRDRLTVLQALLQQFKPYLCLIFVNRKTDIEPIFKFLISNNYQTGQIHGDLQPRERVQTLKRVNDLKYQYVVATDLAARGIDITGVSHVISIDLPKNSEYYIHRSGRTGRGNYQGNSYVLFDTKNQYLVDDLRHKGIKFET